MRNYVIATRTNVIVMHNINNSNYPQLFASLIELRDLLTRVIDTNTISDSTYDALSNTIETTQSRVLNAYEFDVDDDQYRIV